MKKIMLVVSCAALMAALTGCNSAAVQEKKAMDEPFKQEGRIQPGLEQKMDMGPLIQRITNSFMSVNAS